MIRRNFFLHVVEEKRVNEARHGTLHLDWELLARGMDYKPGGEFKSCGSRWSWRALLRLVLVHDFDCTNFFLNIPSQVLVMISDAPLLYLFIPQGISGLFHGVLGE